MDNQVEKNRNLLENFLNNLANRYDHEIIYDKVKVEKSEKYVLSLAQNLGTVSIEMWKSDTKRPMLVFKDDQGKDFMTFIRDEYHPLVLWAGEERLSYQNENQILSSFPIADILKDLNEAIDIRKKAHEEKVHNKLDKIVQTALEKMSGWSLSNSAGGATQSEYRDDIFADLFKKILTGNRQFFDVKDNNHKYVYTFEMPYKTGFIEIKMVSTSPPVPQIILKDSEKNEILTIQKKHNEYSYYSDCFIDKQYIPHPYEANLLNVLPLENMSKSIQEGMQNRVKEKMLQRAQNENNTVSTILNKISQLRDENGEVKSKKLDT